jgi:hypothetical protein
MHNFNDVLRFVVMTTVGDSLLVFLRFCITLSASLLLIISSCYSRRMPSPVAEITF